MKISLYEASKISGHDYTTVKNWVDKGEIFKFEDEAGKPLVDKREFLLKIPTVITFFNQKGGCGRTSACKIIADYYEQKGMKVLIVDTDPQNHITFGFMGYDFCASKNKLTLYDYFENKTPLNKIIAKYSDNIDLIPSTIEMDNKIHLGLEQLDKLKPDFISLFKKYNVVIMDTPPSFNAMSKLCLLLANYVFIPIQASPLDVGGLEYALDNMKLIVKYNTDFYKDFRVIFSLHDTRNVRIKKDIELDIRTQLKNKVFENVIPNFKGVREVMGEKANLFNTYKGDKAIEKILLLMDELDKFMYEERK